MFRTPPAGMALLLPHKCWQVPHFFEALIGSLVGMVHALSVKSCKGKTGSLAAAAQRCAHNAAEAKQMAAAALSGWLRRVAQTAEGL